MKKHFKEILIISTILIASILTDTVYAQISSLGLDLKQEFRFSRNEIYARHGRTFKSTDLQAYFSSQPWYKPNPSYEDALLTEKEILGAKTILKLEQNLESFSEKEKEFAKQLLATIRSFSHREIDTTFLTLGNFDGKAPLDTIQTHISESSEGVSIEYSFVRKGKLLWSAQHKNPYLWMGDHEMIWDLGTNFFFFLSNAVNHCIAKVWKKPSHYEEMKKQWAVGIGIAELNHKEQLVTEETYRKFIDDFDADLLIHSFDEGGGKLQLWYEPVKQFVTFYAP